MLVWWFCSIVVGLIVSQCQVDGEKNNEKNSIILRSSLGYEICNRIKFANAHNDHIPFSCTSSSFLNLSFRFWNSCSMVAVSGFWPCVSTGVSPAFTGACPLLGPLDAISLSVNENWLMQAIPNYTTSAAYQLETKKLNILMILQRISLLKYFTASRDLAKTRNSKLQNCTNYVTGRSLALPNHDSRRLLLCNLKAPTVILSIHSQDLNALLNRKLFQKCDGWLLKSRLFQ